MFQTNLKMSSLHQSRLLTSVILLVLLNLPPCYTSSSSLELDEKSSITTTTTDAKLVARSTSSAVEPLSGKPNTAVAAPGTSLLETPAASEVATDGNYAATFPLGIYPTQDWDGNDGPWSSFAIKVGKPPQTQKVFVSTSARNILLVNPSGCSSADTSNCATLRGGIFNSSRSITWKPNTARGTNATYPISDDSSLGYNDNGTFGYDDVAFQFFESDLGAAANRSIGVFSSTSSYLGLFGILPRSTTFSSSEGPVDGYLQYMFNSGSIPSLTWAYTAGTRVGKYQASLLFGGYDQAKFNAHEITWQFNTNEVRDLTVQLQSINAYGWNDGRVQASLLPSTISAFLDSSLPYIWLPLESCLLFEKRFGLIWDPKTELYLVNETLHQSLLADDPSVIFTLNNGTSGFVVNITLTYALLDLTVSSPIVRASTRYFPLKRASSPSQYILGRTFFQAAYVIADYERGNFSVHSVNSATYDTEEISPIYSPGSTGPRFIDTTGAIEPSFNSSSSVGPAVGGTIGGVALGGILTLIYFFYVRPRQQKLVDEEKTAEISTPPPPPVEVVEDSTFMKPELDNDAVQIYETNADREAVETEVQEQALYELDYRRDIVESDAQERCLYELPAMEEVRTELRAEDHTIVELASPIPQMTNDEVFVVADSNPVAVSPDHSFLPEHSISELDANKDVRYIRLRKTEATNPSNSSSSKWTWISFRQK